MNNYHRMNWKQLHPFKANRSLQKFQFDRNLYPKKSRFESISILSFISFFRNNKGAFRFVTPKDELNDYRKRLTSSDDDYIHLKEDDLKQRLREEKRQGKKAEELLSKLYESHKELLEKYAQAENTIDQLRFQPKIVGDNTPKSSTSEVI